MRVSIWQQFSSNHSSSFTVVGEFQTVEAAQRATDELRRILQTVVDWYIAHPDADEARYTTNNFPPSPPEIAFAQTYGAENPERGIDWLSSNEGIELALTNWERYVFIEPQTNTWCHQKPFDRILDKLGARVLLEASEITQGRIGFEWLTCIVPDENVMPSITNGILYLLPKGPNSRKRRITGQGARLSIENCWLRDVYETLPAIVNYLRERGCTDIQYKLASEIRYDD